MTDEINEIIRVLQLTNYDEDEWDVDNLTVMKKAQVNCSFLLNFCGIWYFALSNCLFFCFLKNAIDSKLKFAHDWLEDPKAVLGGVGEKSLRYILEYAQRVADKCLPPDGNAIQKLAGDITAMTNALCELRQEGKVRFMITL